MKFKRHQKTLESRKKHYHKIRKQSLIETNLTIESENKKNYSVSETPKTSNSQVYSDAQMVKVVGFKDIYPEVKNTPTLNSLLEDIPREKIIKLAQTLINLYKNTDHNGIQKFFSSKNKNLKVDFNTRFEKIHKPNIPYNFCPIQTTTELLKQAFSIPYKHKELKEDKFEENVLKAILIINDNTTNYNHETNSSDTLEKVAEMMVVNSFSQKDINNFDYFEVYREVFTKSVDLFEYVSNDKYFAPIYQEFLKKLQITDYKEYIKTIIGLFAIIYKIAKSKENEQHERWAGNFVYDPKKDTDKLININVLKHIALPIQSDVSLENNDDYKVFRDKPLIKLPDGSYEIVNFGFVLERLFSSLYFDFKNIANKLDLSNFDDEYKQSFMEKNLLCKYLEMINSSKQYKATSSKESQLLSKKGGEPDYYFSSNKGTVILFENKEIMINGEVKQSRDFDKIISEFKNKLLLKTHSNGKEIKKPKPEGIGQLVEQILKIQSGNAFWDKDVSKESTIYPVLVIGDSKLLPDGLAYLMQKWYDDNCIAKKVNINKTKPLIVMSISTLLLYSKEFKKNGFEYYFERYYKSIENSKRKRTKNPFLDITNSTISFSEYMKMLYPKDFIEIYNSYKNKIFP